MNFQKVQLGRNTYKSSATALKYKGPIDLKMNCILSAAGPAWGSID